MALSRSYIWFLLLIFIVQTCAERNKSLVSNECGISQAELNTKHIGRINYRDGTVMISQNRKKPNEFFFTPFPYVLPKETNCYKNELNDRIELGLQIELYTPSLIHAVKNYLHKHQQVRCGISMLYVLCDITLVPMKSIRLVQKSSNSSSHLQKYSVDDSWHSATLLLQSMEFIIYSSSMRACEELRKTLAERCRLQNLEVHYSLSDEQVVQRQVEVTTEYVTSTTIFNRIRAQFPSSNTVCLTRGDFKELIRESMSRIVTTLRVQVGFEDLQEPIFIDKLLEQQLSTEQVELQMINDKVWDKLYWPLELTRPDHLAKVLNTIVRKDDDNSESFIYDRQTANDVMTLDLKQQGVSQSDVTQNGTTGNNVSRNTIDQADLYQHNINQLYFLTQSDRQRLRQLDKLFDSRSQSSSSFNSDNTAGRDKKTKKTMQKTNSNNRTNFDNRQHTAVSDSGVLSVKTKNKHDLNEFNNTQNHLNETYVDKEESGITQIYNNSLDQIGITINNINATKLDKDTEKKYILSRQDVVQFLRNYFDNVYLEGDIIKPRPINTYIVKLGKLNTNKKLFSNTVFIRMRSNVYALPLRCKPDDSGNKSKIWESNRIDQMEDELVDLKDKTDQISSKSSQAVGTIFNKIDYLYVNLTEKLNKVISIPPNARWTQMGVTVAGGNGNGTSTNQLDRPFGLCVIDNYNDLRNTTAVIVADHWNYRIVQWNIGFAINGKVTVGSDNSAIQSFHSIAPIDVLFDKETNSIIIADHGSRRVLRWPRHVDETTHDEVIIDNIRCWGLFMDDQRNLYVSDTDKHEVRQYQLDGVVGGNKGTLVAGGNGNGSNPNQLNKPAFIFVDRQQNVYVSDKANHRVMKWNKGAQEGVVVAGGRGFGSTLQQLSFPEGIFVDTWGHLYVADSGNDRVMRWSPGAQDGMIIVGGNGEGKASNQFDSPMGLSIDRYGNLYVVDLRNHRVQRFTLA
ncbi:unnamed protein product [Rotaria magnacalcarata]|uniref:Uncharacterized protein n=2 Tax=Rotaria magnacalcarata TaxID=392030 RepID=A0A815D425_9BILA|nr:unnamed protein product [Rotaria magnacalcarata]